MLLRIRAQAKPAFVVMSKIPGLDRATGGFHGGELVTISGPTKGGKTLLAQSLTHSFDKQQQPAVWFTYEVPAGQFLGQLGDDPPLVYMPAQLKAHAMPWVEDRILESLQKYHTRIVFIDHLHFLFDMGRSRNPSLEIGQVIRHLKGLAVREGLVVFLLSHTKMAKIDGGLSFESIRDSSFVSQESDSVIMIKRVPAEGPTAARARVEFHRRTGALEQVIKLQKVNGVLVEVADREDPDATPYWDR